MTKPTPPSSSGGTCPRCGTPSIGPFCSNCGAAVNKSGCDSCGAELPPGARFCHRCGAAAGSTVAGSTVAGASVGGAGTGAAPSSAAAKRDPLPWAVAAIALVALIALIAGQKFGQARSGGDGNGARVQFSAPRAPDISGMTPHQMTDRLFDMVMGLDEAGLKDSARYIALTMAIPAFDMHDSLDLDLRYDLGRIAEVTGAIELARGQADTILQQHPTHLLGLALSANVARILGDSATLRSLNQRLLAAEQSELASNLREYAIHKNDLDRALSQARQGGPQ